VKYPILFKKITDLGKVWISRNIFTRKELGGEEDLKGPVEEVSSPVVKEPVSDHGSSQIKDAAFGREEVMRRIERYFDEKDDLIDYLEKFIKVLKDKKK
jgi:hypothetical protein